jgi:hypothetical protein
MDEQLREYLHREPFHPFRLITTSGDRYDVMSPDEVAIAKTFVFYAYPRSDRSAHIRLNQLVAIELLEVAGT